MNVLKILSTEMSDCVTALARWNLADAMSILKILYTEMSECVAALAI